jgi:phosphatidylserine decarboxylase
LLWAGLGWKHRGYAPLFAFQGRELTVAKSLNDWVADDVMAVKDESVQWLSERYFFRDPPRPTYSDLSYFFSPADGIVLYQRVVKGDEPFVEIKGRSYSLREAMRDPAYDRPSLVIGIFMTFYDVHVNRVPYPGILSYRWLDPIDTYNHPMLSIEQRLLEELRVSLDDATYLHYNQRMLNRVDAVALGQPYFVLQIADYDVDCIVPFNVRQHQPRRQGERFSQIRFGSQVDLIVPLSDRYELDVLQETGSHVEASVDPLVKVSR